MDAEPEWEWWNIGNATQAHFSEDAIIQWVELLRQIAGEWTLKPLSAEELRLNVHEFYLIIMRWEFVWCFRVFHPPSIGNHLLELWSVVSIKKWVGRIIAEVAEAIAMEQNIPIIAVTRGRFQWILERRWWEIRSHKYKKRRKETCKSKKILEYMPKKT